MPEVSIVIVNTNTREYVRQCLTSIRDNGDVDAEVIVIENASEDGSGEMLKQFPEARVIANEEKLGFSQNNNLGAEVGTAPLLLFLNPDTETPPGSLRAMLDIIASEPEVAVFGGRCLDADGETERSTGRDPTLTSLALDRLLTSAPPLQPLLERFSQRHYRGYEIDRDVDWVTGAYLWIRTEVFHRIGGWDSSITLYYEDTDLCRRVRDAGFRVRYTSASTINHYHNKTPMVSAHRKKLMRNGLHIFIRKHYGPFRRWLYPRVLGLPPVAD